MRSKREMSTTPVGLPSYFPRSRYVTTGEDLVIDHENKRIVSLPTITDHATLVENPLKHVAIRSVKDQLLNKAENALMGGQSQASNDSGVHPGILYGGPAGGILAPIGVYFYRIFKRKCSRKKKKKKKKTEESDDESEEENEEETVKSTLTTAISSRISNASTSVLNHIKGKFAATGSTLVDDLKAQAIAQEEELLENIKTTMLEQEEELMTNIKEKFAETQNSLMRDIKARFSILEKSRADELSTFDKKRKEEETLIKLSDSEEELMNTVKRRISNAQDEIEKSIETTNENIIKNVENKMPEMKGHTWNAFKARMKDRSGSLFNEIKSILTCTQNKIIDDVKSHIEEVKTDELEEQNSKATDEIRVEIVQPSVKHEETKVQIENTGENSRSPQPNDLNAVSSEISQDAWNQNEKSNIPGEVEANEIKKEEFTDEIIVDTYKTEEHVIVIIESEFKRMKPGSSIISTTSTEQSAEPEDTSRFSKIKHKIIEIPGHFLKPHPKMAPDQAQAEKKKEEIHLNVEKDTQVTEGAIQRTSPIPIPCIHRSRPDHYPTTEGTVSDQNFQDSNSDKSSSDERQDEVENSSFFDRMKNSVTHLPFNFNFSGIPEKVKSLIEPTKRDVSIGTEFTEIKVVGENENSSNVTPSLISDKESAGSLEKQDNDTRESLLSSIDNTEPPPSRRWIVLEYTNEHSPRKTDSKDVKESSDEIEPSKLRWVQFVEEEASAPWPNHLPKNLHGVNGQKDTMKGENSRNHMKKKRREFKNEESDSQEEDDEDLPKETHLLKPMKTEEDRKESIVSSASEFSTTSSVDFTSSGTLESSTSSKLPNFERKSKKKERSARLKSLDSGIHHYYGEYIAIEFPISNSDGNNVARDTIALTDDTDRSNSEENCVRDISNGSEGGSSENSQEDVKSVMSSTEANKEEEVRNDDAAQSSDKRAQVSEDLGGCYEGVFVSLQNSKRSS